MPQNDGRQRAALLTMRRADSICRQAIATTRRRQLSRLLESLELMVNTPARNADEADAKEAAIADLVRRNNPRLDGPPTG